MAGLGGGGGKRCCRCRLALALLLALKLAAGAHEHHQRHLLKQTAARQEQQEEEMRQEPGDLLALESGARILTVGRERPRPPYATNSSLQSPLKLYKLAQAHQATPVFLRQPASGQDLRLYLYPDQSAGLKVAAAKQKHGTEESKQSLAWPQLLRQATLDNVTESLMVTNRSSVSLTCEPNDMLLRLKFGQPFRGLVATKLDRLRSCRLEGTGALHYEWRLPLNDCGTRQHQPRLFINDIQIRWLPAEEAAEDELKTLVCSYPLRPRAEPPPAPKRGLSERIVEEPPPVRLVHYEPLVLVAGLLLLALTLLGLAAGAYLVTRRHRHRRLRSLASSTSNLSSRLYRPPAQLAHLRLAPPLISVAKTARRQQLSTDPKDPQVPSSDSLATGSSSVTTIEIPFVKPTQDSNITQKAEVKKQKRRTLTKESEVQVDSGPPRFGSLRATLTSPNEFKRLQDIARLFDEILIEEHVDKGNDKTLVFKTTRLNPSKYKTKIMDTMDESERRQVSKLIGQDELFRSLVVESTDLETFRRKLRNSPIYKDLLKPATWNLLEEILLDSALNASKGSIKHHKPDLASQKNNQQEAQVKEESVLAQREILPNAVATKPVRTHEKALDLHPPVASTHYREDSLEDESTGERLEVDSRAKQELVDGGGENRVKQSVVKVRQFNSTKTITDGPDGDGFNSTMINIDSVTNFSTSSSSRERFSTFTRSSIAHNRYITREIRDSSEDDDQRL